MARDRIRHDGPPTREDDERVLRMLEARDRKETAYTVARRFGTSRNAVIGVWNRVKNDLAASEMVDGIQP